MISAPPSKLQRQPALVVISPSGARSRVPLHPVPFNIGRQSDNDLILRDNRASRSHARVVLEGGDYLIVDLRSSHGVFVNGKRIERQKLYTGDRIEFGFPDSYSCVFTYEGDELHKILDQFSTTARQETGGAGDLAKLRALVEVARALQNSLSTEDVLAAVVDAALAITGLERGFLLLHEGAGLRVEVARDRYAGPIPRESFEVPLEELERALLHRRELLAMTFDPSAGSMDATHSGSEDTRSVVCVPLVRVRAGGTEETHIITSRSDTVGVVYLDSRQTAVDLSSGNRELLQTLALEASTILENARLLEEERIKRRMEHELSIAREIQSSLLPRAMPASGWFRAAGSSIPSYEVGGDCFDVREITPELWSTLVTDISGKGVSSALLAALIQGGFLMGADRAEGIEATLRRINQFLYERTEGEKYATVFFCTLDRSGMMHWTNAGHATPYLLRSSGDVVVLETTGMPLGMMEESLMEVRTVQLVSGDKLIAYSDGLTEAQNGSGAFFDASRLRRLLQHNASKSAAELHQALMRELKNHIGDAMQSDDITAVVIEYRP
jgi:serine phosphatase RsbU (regulator of sigma subunit)